MEQMIDLRDLLKHEIMDLHSAEQQIIDALPAMIEKAGNDKLKAALKDHLKVTEKQKERLSEIQQLMGDQTSEENTEKRGFFANLFGGEEKCKGMEGLIAEGEKLMGAEMSPEASDAAIIASAQKIEHYEISAYGTARAFARELNLGEVANKLEQTLNEEYAADDLLTQLAVGKVNIEAEFADSLEGGGNGQQQKKSNSKKSSAAKSNGSQSGGKKSAPVKSASSRKASSSKPARKSAPVKKSAPAKKGSNSAAKKGGRSNSKAASKSASKGRRGNLKVTGGKKSASKSSGNRSKSKSRR